MRIDLLDTPKLERMQIELAESSKRLVHVLVSVYVTKLVKDAHDNVLSKPTAMGYTVFIGPELIKMKELSGRS